MMEDFTISEAARRVGCHPNTLLNYEKKNIVHPARDLWGVRHFSKSDIEKARRVFEARWNEGGRPAVEINE